MIEPRNLTIEFTEAAGKHNLDSFILGHSMSTFCEDEEDVMAHCDMLDDDMYDLQSVKAGFTYGAGDTSMDHAMDKYEAHAYAGEQAYEDAYQAYLEDNKDMDDESLSTGAYEAGHEAAQDWHYENPIKDWEYEEPGYTYGASKLHDNLVNAMEMNLVELYGAQCENKNLQEEGLDKKIQEAEMNEYMFHREIGLDV